VGSLGTKRLTLENPLHSHYNTNKVKIIIIIINNYILVHDLVGKNTPFVGRKFQALDILIEETFEIPLNLMCPVF
jgi:hypothetical protein